ncbi:MAG TPA: lactate dehydrogenase [Clostridia bacterium]|nr:lactate dehydrogenase [Clostridia bacterium]
MYFYRHLDKTLISLQRQKELIEITEAEAAPDTGRLFTLVSDPSEASSGSSCVSHADLLFASRKNLSLLLPPVPQGEKLPLWLCRAIEARRVTMINTAYPGWESVLLHQTPEKWRINVAGLGDVGGTLVSGLRLLGGDCISRIGIFDLDASKVLRWEFEANQILDPSGSTIHPQVISISKEQLFDCDMLVFCVTAGVPPVGESAGDVRLAQLEGNSRIIREYSLAARACGFKGIFSVVSDPVDLLCKAAFSFSNRAEDGSFDHKGLNPEQIRGYGLGVMHARAAYFAGLNPETSHYLKEGRAFGPHGGGLVIADSISRYNGRLSGSLTEKAAAANQSVRSLGFKPYIAPALSSGSLSILATLRGQWHYSATFLGGVYFGAKNRLLPSGTELERLDIPEELFLRLESAYGKLGEIL